MFLPSRVGILCAGLLSFSQQWFISRDILVPQKTTDHSRDWFLSTILCFGQTNVKTTEKAWSRSSDGMNWDASVNCLVRWSPGSHSWTGLCCMTVRTGQLSEGRLCICQRLSWHCPGALRHTVQKLLQGCTAVHGHFLSQSTSVLPGIPAVWGVLLLRSVSLGVCCEEGQTSPASRSQLYLHSSKNKEKCSRAQGLSTQPVRILKRRGDKPPRA